MKNYTLTVLLAVLVVLTSVMLRKNFTKAAALSNQGTELLAIGPAPVPLPPHVAAIGPAPVPLPPHVAAIGPGACTASAARRSNWPGTRTASAARCSNWSGTRTASAAREVGCSRLLKQPGSGCRKRVKLLGCLWAKEFFSVRSVT